MPRLCHAGDTRAGDDRRQHRAYAPRSPSIAPAAGRSKPPTMRDRRFLRRALLAPALALLLADIAVVSSAAATSSTAPARPSVAGSIIVGFKPGVSPATQAKALARAGATLRHRFRRIRSTLVAVAPKARPAAIRRLERDPRVAYAEPNFVVHADDVTPNDPFFTQLWGLDNTGQTVNWTTGAPDADIDAKEAWSVS